MTQAQPPAGWYPDPQDATQQRYWDGAAWTGHTAAAGAATPQHDTTEGAAPATPQGDATAGAPIPAASAPAWSMPADAAMAAPAAKRSWFKRPAIIIPIGIVVALFVVGIIVALVNGTDHSTELANAIKSDGQTQLQTLISQQYPGATLKITDVKCVEDSNSQNYTCLIHETVTYQGETKDFIQNADGNCDKKINAHCLWHTTDAPQLSSGAQ
ncbi:MAG TPA: DUF2510 domain-containing protein [Mycobacteriales bacterium]|nr:DUF2510 domain-containing protein [Mycobacteriales bacterium]